MYAFLQHYCWFLVSLLGALLVSLMFVQGGLSLLGTLGKTGEQKRTLLLAIGRKWGLTCTALLALVAVFYFAFPLFFSTSFSGAFWVWFVLLHSFMVQAVSYEFRVRRGSAPGAGASTVFLVLNGVLAPLLLGIFLGTLFNGAEFVVDRGSMPAESAWLGSARGLEAVMNPWNLCLGVAFVFLSRLLACLYFLATLKDADLRVAVRRHMLYEAAPFLPACLLFLWHVVTQDGIGTTEGGLAYPESCKYLQNLLDMPAVAAVLLAGAGLLLAGIIRPLRTVRHGGIWYAGGGTVLMVLALLLCAGWNHTAFYPSLVNLQSSLTIRNCCAGEVALMAVAIASLALPAVLACILWTWRRMRRKGEN